MTGDEDMGFNPVYQISPASEPLPRLRFENNINNNGGLTIFSEGSGGDARFMEIVPAGGHWEIHTMTSLPAGSGLILDANGYPVIQQT
jgi:hypothetical protein